MHRQFCLFGARNILRGQGKSVEHFKIDFITLSYLELMYVYVEVWRPLSFHHGSYGDAIQVVRLGGGAATH